MRPTGEPRGLSLRNPRRGQAPRLADCTPPRSQSQRSRNPTMNEADELLTFRHRLAETIVWCRRRAAPADPEGSLRSEELRPADAVKDDHGWGIVPSAENV